MDILEDINIEHVSYGTLLLLITIGGNFITETFGCKITEFLSNNMLAKQILVFMTIYLAVNFSAEKSQSPEYNIKISILIYLLFLMITKIDFKLSLVATSALILLYIINKYTSFYKEDSSKSELIIRLKNISDLLSKSILFIIVLGFVMYAKKQYEDDGETFSLAKLVFGKKLECENL